jgi:hypothetical protein
MITPVSPNTIVELERLLEDLEGEREAIRKRIEAELDELERRITAIQTVLGSITVGVDTSHRAVAKSSTNGWASALHGLTHFQALVKLAVMSGDQTVRPTDAAKIFQKTGLTKGTPKNMGPHLYKLLRESPQFEKVSPGTFRLKTN